MTKRMQLQLDDDQHALLMELSEKTGVAAASLVKVLLKAAEPQIRGILESVRRAEFNTAYLFEVMQSAVEQVARVDRQELPKLRRAKGSLRAEDGVAGDD